MIVLTILVFVVSIFHGMIAAGSGLQETNRQNSIAAEAARVMVENMRNRDFREVYALYNADASDDPGGAGTAPGHRFAVTGLETAPGAPDGMHGEISFPAQEQQDLSGQGGVVEQPVGGGGAGGAAPTEWRLLETLQDDELGLPRDLNGDSIIDDLDHADDYIILPVRVRVEWEGNHGVRSLELFTMLVDFEVGS